MFFPEVCLFPASDKERDIHRINDIAHSQIDYGRFVTKPQKKVSFLQGFFKDFFSEHPFDGSYAIIIAIGDYDYLPRLDSSAKDAEKMKEFLLNTGEYDEIVMLQDADARFETIRYFMQEYFPRKMRRTKGLRKGRYRFLFFFTGHGTQIEAYTGTMGYLQLKKATSELSNDVINMNQIKDWANQLRNANHMLFLIDCCFSGLAGIETKGIGNSSVNPIELAKENGRFMITAGGADEKTIASLSEWGGSLFTHVAINGMSRCADFNSDGVIVTSELFTYIYGTVKNEASRKGQKQTPTLHNFGTGREKGQYFFVYKKPILPPEENNVHSEFLQETDVGYYTDQIENHEFIFTSEPWPFPVTPTGEDIQSKYTPEFERRQIVPKHPFHTDYVTIANKYIKIRFHLLNKLETSIYLDNLYLEIVKIHDVTDKMFWNTWMPIFEEHEYEVTLNDSKRLFKITDKLIQ